MASVHLGQLVGPAGFCRTVAIKRPHPHLAREPEFVAMFVDEARLASRIRHPNVVPTTDVVVMEDEVLLVMEYVQGESLARIVRSLGTTQSRLPVSVALSIVIDALYGLHAAHEARDDKGEPLGLVHRDVSPHNVVVGRDGAARLVDFGIAKARTRAQTTGNSLKGKLAYMAPEQLSRRPIDRRTDVFAASVVLWEILTGKRLFGGEDETEIFSKVLTLPVVAPSQHVPGLPKGLDELVLKGLCRTPDERWETAEQMARALEGAAPPARHPEVGEWVERAVGDILEQRAARIAAIERSSDSAPPSRLAPDGGGADGAASATMATVPESAGLDSTTTPVGSPSGDRPPSPLPSDANDEVSNLEPAVGTIALADGPISWRPRRWLRATGGTAMAFALFAMIGARIPRKGTTHEAANATAIASAPEMTASAAPIVSSPAVTVPSSPSLAAPPEPGPRARAATHANPARRPSVGSSVDCSTPYYFDADHVKRFKPSCL